MNADYYRERIKRSGLKLAYVAEQMGIHRKTLWAKITGKGGHFTDAEERLFLMITDADAMPARIKEVKEKL